MMPNEETSILTSVTRIDSAIAQSGVGVLTNPRAEPLIKIRPQRSAISAALKESWAARELLFFLIWRDLKVRYRQTVLGSAWVILQPALMALVFTIFMSKLARVPSNGVPYPLFAYAGLLPWIFFSNSVSTSSYSLISNSHLLTKVYFPRLILPAAIVGVRLFDLLVALIALAALMLYYGIGPTSSILLLPVLLAEITLFTFGIGLWFSVLTIKYRDIGTVLPVLIQLWMFGSPIIYPASLVPERWRLLYWLNPISGIVEGIRAALFGLAFDWLSMMMSAFVTLLLAAYFLQAFCRVEESLIDIL